MPTPRAIDSLSPDQRTAFEQELIRRNFADYDGLVAWLEANGLSLSRSAAGRYGAKLKRRIQAVKDSTEGARMLAEAAPDESDLRSAAVISMVQSELFEVMVSLQELDSAEPAERVALLKEAAKSVLDMTRAANLQKKWQQDMTAKIRQEAKEQAAAVMTEATKAMGLDDTQAKFWREKVLMGGV